MQDLIGYTFKVEHGEARVTGPSQTAGYIIIEITDEKGMKSESLRVESQVRRAKAMEEFRKPVPPFAGFPVPS